MATGTDGLDEVLFLPLAEPGFRIRRQVGGETHTPRPRPRGVRAGCSHHPGRLEFGCGGHHQLPQLTTLAPRALTVRRRHLSLWAQRWRSRNPRSEERARLKPEKTEREWTS